ncbi:hypothetical protein A2619_02625 [candidate division WWE3 bacterium RIFOXYD1_FULL_39_9]|uniref:Uncharacterized protein n=1 Tax=candidate division WWE3 bacterium RIFOXYD1_FULL_39_9 TaxID=1802649 RepID=A0A1F4X967_UNCKA|nr:MAG: hypothetical protein A2619_02625 [candidate division WWE3 bacterium RIFOXYD1_FULL_39_9]
MVINKLTIILLFILILVTGLFYYLNYTQKQTTHLPSTSVVSDTKNITKPSEKNITQIKFQLPNNWDKKEKTYNDGSVKVSVDPLKVKFDEAAIPEEKRAGLVEITYNLSNIASTIDTSDLKQVYIGKNSALISFVRDEKTGADLPSSENANKHIINYYIQEGNKTTVILSYVSDLNEEYLEEFNQIVSSLEILK